MWDFDFGLGETLDMLRDSVRDFAGGEIAPLAAQIDATNEFPRALWPRLGALGAFGITVEERYGGAGLGYLAHCVAMEEISRASASVGLSYGAHSNLCVNQIHRFGSEEQKDRYLPKLISGENLGALAMSESGAGSDVMSLKLRAVQDGDAWRLTGNKMWITNGPGADVLVVYATVDPNAGQKGVTACAGGLRHGGPERGAERRDRLPDRARYAGLLDRPETRQARHARLRHL